MNILQAKLISLVLIVLMALSACNSSPATVVETIDPITEITESGNPVDNFSTTETSQNSTNTAIQEQPIEVSNDLLETHESEDDYSWNDAEVVDITLSDDSSSSTSPGVKIAGNQITITAGGTYRLKGKLSDGQVLVESVDDEIVRLILNGVDINSGSSAPVYIKKAEKAVIILADGTQNQLTDTANYVFASADEDEPKATLFSNEDLTIFGKGILTVIGQYNDAISTDDGLLINGASISIQAVDDGIRGKNYLVTRDANLELVSGGDGLTSDNDDTEKLGQIQISNSSIIIDSMGDAISAEGEVMILSADVTIHTGNASFNADSMSAKGIKGLVSVVIYDGEFSIDAMEDALHSNGDITIHDGNFTISSGDDGIHADLSLTINGGSINITKSYEGLEARVITLNGGDISLIASDDGINSAGGADGSGMAGGWGMPGGQAPWEQDGATTDYWVYINGGTVYVNASGDGVDSNGSIEMTGGILVVDGPTMDGNGPLDYMGTFNISGGTMMVVGSVGMAQAPSTSSTQPSIFIGFNQAISASTLIHLQTSSGHSLLTYAPSKEYQSVLISSPELELGESYVLYTGGSVSGEIENYLYINAQYQPGNELAELMLSSSVTTYGTTAGFGDGGFPGGGGRRRP